MSASARQSGAERSVTLAQPDELVEMARSTVSIEIDGLRQLHDSLGEDFACAVAKIHRCVGRVIIVGIGKSGHIGSKIAATLASTGTPSFFVHAAEAAHGDLGMIGSDDIVLCISNSGESAEFKPVLQYCRRFSIFLVVMTSAPASTLGQYADLLLLLPQAKEACPMGLAPMTSTTLMLAMGDALAAALIRARGFQRDDFAKFHPAGKLGAQLLRLREILELQPDRVALPRVAFDAPMADVITTITDGRLGITGVVGDEGNIVGIVTDGDLRRALTGRECFDKTAQDIMSREPVTIGSDCLAIDALNLCQSRKIGAVLICDEDGRIIGAAHLKELLQMGLV
ncbi:SIS domain-containing protein [Notoacmeibacter sp. MSK16QG-6]|uniref:KpsF/GutQ family sugar-phosphate isomerase n=1 Tax=Notoacmeibacter sp. MSK16QG-6 TaxID=2957982 RepID=UPI00209FEE65|nr:KpsF/GutQ family sugar-phosphate isomerase [Notoacmeibacter sp. MSK16QG-6]MCP1198073.1 KpsF/GutQ family sugar-phosphate isomerase [Notoacmeibacter sp. MSK16QG-6]